MPPVVRKSRDVPRKVAVPHNRNLSRNSFAAPCLGFGPLKDTTQGNLFVAGNCGYLLECLLPGFSVLDQNSGGRSQQEMICLEIMCCLGRAVADVVDALISWAGTDIVMLTFKKGTGPCFSPCLMMESECFI